MILEVWILKYITKAKLHATISFAIDTHSKFKPIHVHVLPWVVCLTLYDSGDTDSDVTMAYECKGNDSLLTYKWFRAKQLKKISEFNGIKRPMVKDTPVSYIASGSLS